MTKKKKNLFKDVWFKQSDFSFLQNLEAKKGGKRLRI